MQLDFCGMFDAGGEVTFPSDYCAVRLDSMNFKAYREHGLYRVECIPIYTFPNLSALNVDSKRKLNLLWHARLGHPGKTITQKIMAS